MKLVEICKSCCLAMDHAGYKNEPVVKEGKRCWRCGTKVPFWFWYYV